MGISFLVLIAILFFPYKTEGRGERLPVFSILLAVAILFVHLLLVLNVIRHEEAAGGIVLSFFEYGLLPARFNWASPLTSLLLHGDWLHVIANAYALWLYGAAVERRIGTPLTILIAVASAYAGGLGYLYMTPAHMTHVPGIGASTALAGLMGATLLVDPAARVVFFTVIPPHRLTLPAFLLLVPWFAGQLLEGFAGIDATEATVNHWGHVFGFVGGILAGLACRYFVLSRDLVAKIQESSRMERATRLYAEGKWSEAAAAMAHDAREKTETNPHEEIERVRLDLLAGRDVRDRVTRLCEDFMLASDEEAFLQAFAILESLGPPGPPVEMLRTAGLILTKRGNAPEALRCRVRQLAGTKASEERERVLFQIVTLIAEKIGDPDLARAACRRHLELHPGGKHAKDVEFILTRKLGVAGQ